MQYIRRSEERGQVNLDWLQSKHSFSFGHYYDPKHMGVSVLRVINQDVVAPNSGFETHGHRDMEIISYVLRGSLEHKDSEGNVKTIKQGEVQRMSAGSGILHSEYNPSATEEAEFLQIWIKPKFTGITPSYEQREITQTRTLTPLVNYDGHEGALSINQDARIDRLILKKGDSEQLQTSKDIAYLHLIAGELTINGHLFQAGDAFSAAKDETINVTATEDVEALWFDLPKH
ncbi:pirin family protein [Catenovulum sp. SM1970]|uniref:pirin family protein n=1 Tax=Marinifaba aquimaris TaxID=2741323 RepID=UPI001572B946|nr:pirin family protein [Marinifaba aquimaris]NTS76263.1 pirin family protein [Marinifaba aquimaris]